MASTVVIDCTNDINIHNFLNSEKCQDLRIRSIHLDDISSLPSTLAKMTPACIIISTNNIEIQEMYKAISENFTPFKFILCVGETRTKKDKQKLKLLQQEYNCYIIENVVTDFLLLNYILECAPEEVTYSVSDLNSVISTDSSIRTSIKVAKEHYESLPQREESVDTSPKQEMQSSLTQKEIIRTTPTPVPTSTLKEAKESLVELKPIVEYPSEPNTDIGDTDFGDVDFGTIDKYGDAISPSRLDSNVKKEILGGIPTPTPVTKKSNIIDLQNFSNQKSKQSETTKPKQHEETEEDYSFE